MAFEDYSSKDSVVIVYTGEGKGKTSASIGLVGRALGTGWRVGYVQFIKSWDVGEHKFFDRLSEIYTSKFTFYKSGSGFYKAGELSAAGVDESEHKAQAQKAYDFALESAIGGKYEIIVCDEINNAVNDGLLSQADLRKLIETKSPKTSLCLTGRDFPEELLQLVDIATEMKKVKHHFDDKFLANKGIDY